MCGCGVRQFVCNQFITQTSESHQVMYVYGYSSITRNHFVLKFYSLSGLLELVTLCVKKSELNFCIWN